LLEEAREHEARVAAAMARNEAKAVAAWDEFRGKLWRGLDATELPVGVSAGDAMAEAARESVPKRQSVIEEALTGTGVTYHQWPDEAEAS
jgi:hypothetical protein